MDCQSQFYLIKGLKEPLHNFHQKSQKNAISLKQMNYLLDEVKYSKNLDHSKTPISSSRKQVFSNILIIPPFDLNSIKNNKLKLNSIEKKTFRVKHEQFKESIPFEKIESRKISKEFPTRSILHMKKFTKRNLEIDFFRSFSPEIRDKKPYTVSPLSRFRLQNKLKNSAKHMHTNMCFFDHTVPESIIIKSKSPEIM